MSAAFYRNDSDLAWYRQFVLELFQKYDANSDGYISKDELGSLLAVLDKAGSLEFDGIDSMLKALDRNGDGLVDIEEFVDWVMHAGVAEKIEETEDQLSRLRHAHAFLTPQDEADMERCTLWHLRADENSSILAESGLCSLNDPSLLMMSVGSSSTQCYDTQGFAMSVPVGNNIGDPQGYRTLTDALINRGVNYSQVILMNSIGYSLTTDDPRLLDLSELSTRAAAEGKATISDLYAALHEALPSAKLQVYNRSKDPTTKRYKHPQLVNDWSQALVSEHGQSFCTKACGGECPALDAIVDWGGGSYKVYAGGKRLGTELMEANGKLCEGGVLRKERFPEAIRGIKLFVLKLLPEAQYVMIAQTGHARELAMREDGGRWSCC